MWPEVHGDGEFDLRHDERGHASGRSDRAVAGQEDRRLTSLMGEEVVAIDGAARPTRSDFLSCQQGTQFAECALVLGVRVSDVDDICNRCCRHRRRPAVFDNDRDSVDWRLEQIAERCHRLLGAGQGHFEALKVGSDQHAASSRICRRDDRVNLLEGHVQRPEPPDHLRGRI